MDREISVLRRALAETPADLELRARLLRARARGREPQLMADFEAAALALEAAAVIAAHHEAFLENPAEGFGGLRSFFAGRPALAVSDETCNAFDAYLASRPPVLNWSELRLPRRPLHWQAASIWRDLGPVLEALLASASKRSSSLIARLEAILLCANRLMDRAVSTAQRQWYFSLAKIGKTPSLQPIRRAIEQALLLIDPNPLFLPQVQRSVEREVNAAFDHMDLTRGVAWPALRLFPEAAPREPEWPLRARPGPWTPLLTHFLERLAPRIPVLYPQEPLRLKGLSIDLKLMNTVEGWILFLTHRC